MSVLDIRPASVVDVPRVVAVHLEAFPGFFLSSLGPTFLALFYAKAIKLGEIAYVATIDGLVVGFVMGSDRPHEFYGKLLRRSAVKFVLAAAPTVLRRPGVALRVARALRKPIEAHRPPGTATLMSIGVRPDLQRRGIGRLLTRAFLDEAWARGATRVDLTTDTYRNEQANSFYRRLGFLLLQENITFEGRHMNEYVREKNEYVREIDVPRGVRK